MNTEDLKRLKKYVGEGEYIDADDTLDAIDAALEARAKLKEAKAELKGVRVELGRLSATLIARGHQ